MAYASYEKQLEANRKWRKANKDKVRASKEEWIKENWDKILKYNRKEKSKHIDNHYSVYLLPNENYVGQSNQLRARMYNHKALGRDVSDYVVLHTFETREEAKKKEAEYHAMGYTGFNKGH
jgi:hypothetical protein